MNKDLMANALKSVLGEGYEARSHMSAATGTQRSPSPHDFLQGRVSKSGPSGTDLHVPTTIDADKPKKRGKLKSVEYVTSVSKGERKDKVGQRLVAAGAVGGVLSLPSLKRHTENELRRAGVLKPAKVAAPATPGRVKGALKPVVGVLERHPRAGAGLAAGAAGLELAGLTGDFVAHSALKDHVKTDKRKVGVIKALAPTPAEDTITFSKIDTDKRQVFGWCSVSKKDGVEVVDLQGDYVPIEETEKSAYQYMLMSRKGGDMHARVTKNFGMEDEGEPLHIGDVIESMVFTPEKISKMGLPETFPQGWWIGLQIHDENTWGAIKRGERTGFSIHGKGRREELVAKTYDSRKEKAKDIALGTAGAVAAGSGGGAALIPLAARRGLIGATKAERVGGRLKTLGAVVGGTAGVYGGLHAVHQAAKTPAVRELPRKARDKVTRTPVRKAWSPVVERKSPEARRQRRAGQYQGAAAAGAAGAAGGAIHQVRASSRAMNRMVGADTVGIVANRRAGMERDRFVAAAGEAKGAHAARLAAKPNQRGVPQMKAGHRNKMNAMGEEYRAKKVAAVASVENRAKARNLKAVESAAVHSRRAGKLGALGAGLAAGAEVIRRKRKGSWRPYSGTR